MLERKIRLLVAAIYGIMILIGIGTNDLSSDNFFISAGITFIIVLPVFDEKK